VPDLSPPGSALAARCTACSTVFRVVPDQLRVSDGWVRCGRCSQVFNAAENLIDLDTGAPRRLDLGGRRPGLPALPAPPTSAPADDRADTAIEATQPLYGPPGRDLAEPPPPEPRWTAQADTEPPTTGGTTRAEGEADPAPGTGWAPAAPEASLGPEPAAEAEPPVAPQASPVDPVPAPAMPSFVQRADRAARWRQPRVRAALAGASACAVLLLVAQVVFTYRDLAAARWPELRAPLEAGCRLLGCRVGPAQAIESITVESSGLVRVEQTRLYQLTVGLRNRAAIDLAVPALELSLTDAQGRLLTRRVLRAAELGVTQPSLAAGRDLALQATLQTAPQSTGADGDAVVVGYTIELFYP
jgi:predicted Zn finger-like uncharacterized protein